MVTRTLKCRQKMAKWELVVARTLKSRISCTLHHSNHFVSPHSLPHITRDHHARLVSSNRERFPYYQHISYFFEIPCMYTRARLKKKILGPAGSYVFRVGRQHKFFGRQKFSALQVKNIQLFLEAFSLSLVFSVQTKPNKTLHLNVTRSKQKNNFNAEIYLPYSNWLDHLSFFWPFKQSISS